MGTTLICGATQGVGLELTKRWLRQKDDNHVIATFRQSSDLYQLETLKTAYPNQLDLHLLDAMDESSFQTLGEFCRQRPLPVDTIINCIGVLKSATTRAERSLAEVDVPSMVSAFQQNTLPTILLAKYLKATLLKSSNPKLVALSAKVGSIEDNQIGGWHAYRTSKAALNMVIKNVSIEYSRMGRKCCVFSIHPGTTETQLSAPFMEGARKKYKIHTAAETAKNIETIVMAAQPETHNGAFFSWDGQTIPW